MKIKLFFLSIVLILSTASFSFAQPEQTRGAGGQFSHDFSTVSEEPSSFTFHYANKSKSVLKVIDIDLPAQVSVTIVSKKIRANGSLDLVIVADPLVMNAGKFDADIVVTLVQNQTGIKTTKVITFNVVGIVEN